MYFIRFVNIALNGWICVALGECSLGVFPVPTVPTVHCGGSIGTQKLKIVPQTCLIFL